MIVDTWRKGMYYWHLRVEARKAIKFLQSTGQPSTAQINPVHSANCAIIEKKNNHDVNQEKTPK